MPQICSRPPKRSAANGVTLRRARAWHPFINSGTVSPEPSAPNAPCDRQFRFIAQAMRSAHFLRHFEAFSVGAVENFVGFGVVGLFSFVIERELFAQHVI